MKTKIFVMTHKLFETPPDTDYIPLQVGRAANPKPELAAYLGDDTGDNISDQNCYYSELTGQYWVWKNVKDADIVGTCHYRRYLLNDKGYMFKASEIESLLKDYDCITTKELDLNFSYYYGFGENHKIIYLDKTLEVVKEKYPEHAATFEELVHKKHTYFGNMMICKKEFYDAYMEFLFGVLFEVQKRVRVEEEDSYHRRIFGFISEFLLYVWLKHNQYRVCECMVGMLGEKAETREVKNTLAAYFKEGDFAGAKAYFLKAREKRPDILMEASDVTGELHMCMQVIVTAGMEQEKYGRNLLNHMQDFHELMDYCNHLNAYHRQLIYGDPDEELETWVKNHEISDLAHMVSAKMMEAGPIKKM